MKKKLFLSLPILFVLFTSFYKPSQRSLPSTVEEVKYTYPILSGIYNGSSSSTIVFASLNDVSSGGTPVVYTSILPNSGMLVNYQSSTDSVYIQTKISGGTFSHVDIIDNATSAVLDSKVYNPSSPIYHLSFGGNVTATMFVYN